MSTKKSLAKRLNMLLHKDFGRLLGQLQREYDFVCGERDSLRDQLNVWNRDGAVVKLKEELKSINRHSLFQMSDREMDAVNAFRSRHYELCKNGSRYQYELGGTSIGTAITIGCPVCGETQDVTDYGSW